MCKLRFWTIESIDVRRKPGPPKGRKLKRAQEVTVEAPENAASDQAASVPPPAPETRTPAPRADWRSRFERELAKPITPAADASEDDPKGGG